MSHVEIVENKQIFATVQGTEIVEVPPDLFVPSEALEVFLESFQGPLDFLLYLIRKQNLNILDIPVAKITQQYLEYIAVMKSLRLEIAGEYLAMAAILTEIKSRMLLPKPKYTEEEEEDPRAELVRRLQEYERFKKAAENIDTLPRQERDLFVPHPRVTHKTAITLLPHAEIAELVQAYQNLQLRLQSLQPHNISLENLRVSDKIALIQQRLSHETHLDFYKMLQIDEGRWGVIVTFIAMLELSKENIITITQNELFSPIYIKLKIPS